MIRIADAPKWLDAEWLLGHFGRQRKEATLVYRRDVMGGKGVSGTQEQTRHQFLLSDESFLARHRQENQNKDLREHSKAYRQCERQLII